MDSERRSKISSYNRIESAVEVGFKAPNGTDKLTFWELSDFVQSCGNPALGHQVRITGLVGCISVFKRATFSGVDAEQCFSEDQKGEV